MNDPFTLANRALLQALYANPAFSEVGGLALVRVQNRLATVKDEPHTFQAARNINRQYADAPELLLTQGGFLLVPKGRNSRAVSAEQTFTLQLVENRPTVERLNALKWETFRALVDATLDVPHPFGLSFVSDWRIEAAAEGRTPGEDAQQTGDWVAVLNIVLEMYWDRRALP